MDRVDVTPTLETYKSLTPIKWFCNKVLPCVYDDTLSDYELICKCIKYLNDMVSNNEGVQENVQKLYDAFVQLQEWVNANVNDEVFAEFVNNYVSDNEEFIESVKTIAEPIVKDVVDEYIESVTEMNVPHLAFMTPTGYVGKPSFRRIVEEDLPSTITDVVAVKTANTFFASPDGSGGTPSFRKMVMSDLPNAVPEHIGSRDNPHVVTTEQIGAVKVSDVVDNLNSTSTTSPLSANQGRLLNEGKAPSGYGLGTFAREILDANTAIENGWYKLTSVNTSEAHIPFQYVVIHVTAYSDRYIIQNLYRTDVSGTHMQRVMYDGAWGEWVNVSASAFAPSGYGLGATNGVLITDGNDATRGGDYFWGNVSTNLPFTYGFMHVGVRVNGSLIQTAYSEVHQGCSAQRKCTDGTWGEWEWVNPPMELGVEYRTTERWQGKPVYTVRIG